MRKRMLRSVLAAALSAVLAFGAVSGLTGAKSDVRADSSWSLTAPAVAETPLTADDSSWA
ncbi:hypothetical protein SAV14893_039660 [Streptomyces avermitilis]|uniref:Secreted protein n=1 Tax=Streptomyces avermitilis TaxID=33903 RepID=A0A4D4MV70_STRAX|nr:hypothetical protein [Streptomyces sp. SID5469]BBJ52537.1 hypothetical protein SAVMC3_51660 [Streptomyces avermitilis]GDY64573.1 hypothetical protein SAV14893_039660 [Streptomyces avermitilis]GDY75249.1 hypothetical protein SAV31267_047340 [Streptomyces avermitilis]GDY84258.1 hypothetical protein SAVCW2_34570 [Streptomyces avermitilis]